MPISREFANSVLQELERRGNSSAEIHSKLDNLNGDEQQAFISQAATKLGMSERPAMHFTPDAQTVSTSEALALGAAGGAAFGAGKSLATSPLEGLTEQAIAKGSQLTGLGNQDIARQVLQKSPTELGRETGKLFERSQLEHPTATDIGGLASGTGEAMAMGMGATKPLAIAGRGALTGALQGYNATEGNVPQKLYGATKTGVAQGLLSLIPQAPKLLKGAGEGLRNIASDFSNKLVGISGSRIEKLGLDKARKIGQLLKEESVSTSPALASTLQKSVEAEKQILGDRIAGVYTKLDESVPAEQKLTTTELKQVLSQHLTPAEVTPGTSRTDIAGVQRELKNFFDVLPADKPIAFTDVWDLAKSMETKARKYSRNTDAISGSKADNLEQIASTLRQFLHTTAADMAPTAAADLDGLGKLYQAYSEASSGLTAKVTASRGAGGARFSLSKLADKTIAATPVKGATIYGLDTVGKLLQTPAKLGKYAPALQEAMQRGPASLAAAHFTLSQTDPKYRAIWQDETDQATINPKEQGRY